MRKRPDRDRKAYDRAEEKKKEQTEEMIEGRNPVKEALLAERAINKLWLLAPREGQGRDSRLLEIEQLARDAGVLIHMVEREALDRISDGGRHQGVIAQAAAHEYADAMEVIAKVREEGRDPFILILDSLQDGRNLGAILRIAEGAGVDLVVIPERRSVSLDQYVAKASAGAIEYVPVARETNLTTFVLDLKEAGFWIFGTDADATIVYDKADFSGSIALMIGNEGKGISPKLKEHCDFLLSIPMWGELNSLNASVACGIVTYAAALQRKRKEGQSGETEA